jgi:hypothetical protein
VRFAAIAHSRFFHIAAQSQRGGMSAAGESRLCIVIATCAGSERITEVKAKIEARQRQALALGAQPIASKGGQRRFEFVWPWRKFTIRPSQADVPPLADGAADG